MRFRFEFRVVPFIATVIVMSAGIALAQWQTNRAEQKIALQEIMRTRQSAPPMEISATSTALPDIERDEYRSVKVKGEFLDGWPIYLDNRPHDGVAGFYLLMPFRIAATNVHVLVARGWFPRNAVDRTRLPTIDTPQGQVEIAGVLRRDIGHVMQLGDVDQPKPRAIVQNLDLSTFSARSGLRMLPMLIQQTSDAQDRLVRDWPVPSLGIDKHRGYAFQWYALTAMAFLFFVVTGFRRGTR